MWVVEPDVILVVGLRSRKPCTFCPLAVEHFSCYLTGLSLLRLFTSLKRRHYCVRNVTFRVTCLATVSNSVEKTERVWMKSRQNVNTILTGKRTGRCALHASGIAGSIYTDKVSGQNKTDNTANLKHLYKIISLWLWVKVCTSYKWFQLRF